MASTIWKGQLTFGLVSFPVRLQKAARRERIPLKYVKETRADEDSDRAEQEEEPQESKNRAFAGGDPAPAEAPGQFAPVRQGYFSQGLDPLQKGRAVKAIRNCVHRCGLCKRRPARDHAPGSSTERWQRRIETQW